MNFTTRLSTTVASKLNEKINCSKCLVLAPSAQQTLRLSSRTPRLPFNVFFRTGIYIRDILRPYTSNLKRS